MNYKRQHTWSWASLFGWILNWHWSVSWYASLFQNTKSVCVRWWRKQTCRCVIRRLTIWKEYIAHRAGISGRWQTGTKHTWDLKPTHTLSWESHLCLKSRDITAGEIHAGTELTHLNECNIVSLFQPNSWTSTLSKLVWYSQTKWKSLCTRICFNSTFWISYMSWCIWLLNLTWCMRLMANFHLNFWINHFYLQQLNVQTPYIHMKIMKRRRRRV